MWIIVDNHLHRIWEGMEESGAFHALTLLMAQGANVRLYFVSPPEEFDLAAGC